MDEIKIKSLAIIPARGGSKRLPRKNVLGLAGKPLVCWTMDAALKSGCFSRIILSSDDDEILDLAKKYDGIDAVRRDPKFAADTAKALDLVCHMVDDIGPDKFDTVTLLLPTCPFRNASDIKEGFKLLTEDVDSVVSIMDFEFPPQLSIKEDKETGLLKGVFDPCPLITGDTRSQDQEPIYRPNGGFYMSWWNSFVKNRNYFKGKVKGYHMPRYVDIDEKVDLKYAQFLIDEGVIKTD